MINDRSVHEHEQFDATRIRNDFLHYLLILS